MAEDSAPPPPPLSPPPALEATTIGKYIARFRYEKPQPREARVAAQQSEFWWTKSPRYSRSPSPPSTWASGGVFFSGDELDEELAAKSEEEETKIQQDDDSIESKLRRRLGLSSDSKLGISDTRDALRTETPEVMQSWDSEEWGSVDLEEEDPEEVIERVRKRLGWSATSGGTSAKLKPIEFQLAIDSNRDSGRRHVGMKPPLSPGFYRKEETLDSFDYRSSSKLSERGYRERFEETSPISNADAKDTSMVVEAVEEKESVHRVGVSFEAREARSVLSSTGFEATALPSSSSSVDSHSPRRSRSNEDSNDPLGIPVNSRVEEVDSSSSSPLSTFESKGGVEEREEKMQALECAAGSEVSELPLPPTTSPTRPGLAPSSNEDLSGGSNDSNVLGIDAGEHVPELPALPPASPACPDLASGLTLSLSNLSAHFHGSSLSSPRKEDLISGEAAKTLDSLVSSVLHDWEKDFYSFPQSGSEEEQVSLVDGNQNHRTESKDPHTIDYTCLSTTPVNENFSTVVASSSGDQNFSNGIQSPITAVSTSKNSSQEMRSSEVADARGESTCNSDGEDKLDFEVPEEDNDEIVQMLLGRIALLEEALRHIDR